MVGKRTLCVAAIAALSFVATGADAAKVSEVRVGTHDQHTRIVLELDAATGYRLVAPQPGAKPELVVTLDATSVARDVPSKSPLVRKVHVEPSGNGSSVRIRLATADVAVKEMLLANPPRLVFDLSSRGPIPKPTAEELAEEAAAAAPAAVAEAPAAEEPKSSELPKPAPIAVARPEPAKADAPAPIAIAPPAPSDPAEPVAETLAAEPAPIAVAEVDPTPKPVTQAPSPEERRKALAAKAAAETTPAAPSQGFFGSPMGMAAIGGAVVLLLAIVVMRRRRAAQDEDPLYTVMSAEDQSAIADVSAEIGSSRPAPPAWDTAAFETSEPSFVKDGPRQLPLGAQADDEPEVAAEPAPEPEPFAAADESPDSIFASDLKPLSAAPVEAPVIAAPMSASVATPAVAAEMERRLGELERRLEQLTEARERLERQVAAQTEELRVQRAAIARTQRVVRSIAKTEDMATEPVPRAPSA
jgi:hypothetical protein